jgi:hypothetical protein
MPPTRTRRDALVFVLFDLPRQRFSSTLSILNCDIWLRSSV